MTRRLSSLWSDKRGNSFVEMGLIAPVLATLLMGAIDISRAVSAKVQAEQAAQRAIELAQVNGYSSGATLTSAVQTEAQTAAGSGATASASAWLECNHDGSSQLDYDTGTCPTGQAYARYVSVTVTNYYTPLFGTTLFPKANSDGTVTVKGYAELRTQ
jgi:Flp pilus assembly protein TadG